MSSFLNSSQIFDLTGALGSHYETFSTGSNNYISIVKSPIKIINNTTENVMPGYGADTTDITSITYQPVTGVFPAVIIYPKQEDTSQFGQLKFNLDSNQIIVKVQQLTRDYIITDKTERIIANGITYGTVDNTYNVQNYFGLKFYYFKLTSTK